MPALDPETHERWRDLVVVDRESATVGTIETFYLDQASGLPTWALVHSGWLGDRRSFVPLAGAVEVDGEIRLPYTKAQIREAPAVASDGGLSADDELALVGHYGLHDLRGAVAERPRAADAVGADVTGTGVTEAGATGARMTGTGVTEAGATGARMTGTGVTGAASEPHPPVSGAPEREGNRDAEQGWTVIHTPRRPVDSTRWTDPAAEPGDADAAAETGDAGAVVTRSEEELVVGRRTRLRRLRLRKYVVTEYVTRTFPVRREQVRLEEVAAATVVDGGADDWDDPAPDGATQVEVVLYREEPEIRLRAVPVERARLVKRLVSEQRTITEELRKERVEVDQPPSSRP
jgi:stress response protein YsnF